MAHSMSPDIFREYDIRGIYGLDLKERDAALIGRAYGTLVKKSGGRIVSVGRDCRLSSPGLSESLIQGITDAGVSVIEIGLVSTPVLYFSLFNLQVDGGVMITASHNPKDYNGMKMCVGKSSLFGDGIQGLKKLIEKGDFEKGRGSVQQRSVMDVYSRDIVKGIKVRRGLKVAIDCGNGMVGLMGPAVLREIGCDLTELYSQPDGTFPNHHPDPTVEENLKDLRKAVVDNGCEVGIAFDGDGDRIGVLDEKGEVIWGDMLVLIYALSILKKSRGAAVIGDVKCSSNLFSEIKKAGGDPVMWKTGHSLMKSKIKETGAVLAGEMSGHVFFNDRFYGYDDALYAALRLLEIISDTEKKVSQLLSHVPRTYCTPEIRVDCEEKIKFELVKRVTEKFRSDYEVVDIDGVRVDFSDGWGLVRASNTQPALVMRFEAQSKKRLDEIKHIVESKLRECTDEI